MRREEHQIIGEHRSPYNGGELSASSELWRDSIIRCSCTHHPNTGLSDHGSSCKRLYQRVGSR